jgi:flagellar export protein FliJ
MKKFEFRLQRVLELRSQQVDIERARLQSLLNGRARLTRDRNHLVQQQVRAAADVRNATAISGSDLCALASYDRHLQKRKAILDKQLAQLEQQIAIQTVAVREAEKKVKLLEKLKQRKLGDWTAERDKELEIAAAESYLARFLGDRRTSSRADADSVHDLEQMTGFPVRD